MAKGIKPNPKVASNGGVTAPASGAGLYAARSVGGRGAAPKGWDPKGEVKNTEYAKNLRRTANAAGAGGSAGSQAPTPMPWDSAYEASVSGARTKFANSQIGIAANRLSLQQEYGLDPGFNDYQTNPWSRAALLEQSFQRSNRGSLTSMAAAGHLYSGSLQNQLGYNRTNRDREDNNLRGEYLAKLGELQAKERAAEDELHGGEAEASWRRVEAAEKEPLDTSTVSGGKGGGKKKKSGGGSYAKTKGGNKYGIGKGGKAR